MDCKNNVTFFFKYKVKGGPVGYPECIPFAEQLTIVQLTAMWPRIARDRGTNPDETILQYIQIDVKS